MNTSDRFRRIKRVLIYVLVLNWLVAFAKIIYGVITKCASMSADGMHSFSDGASNIIGLIGIWAASQPVDKSHPYGHKKYETFSSLGIAMLLVLLVVKILHDALARFSSPVLPDVNRASFVVMLSTLAINLYVMWYEIRKSKELKSDILYSDAMHTRSDILVSISVIATLVAIKIGWPALDTIVAVVIAALIGYSAFRIAKESSDVLCDRVAVMSNEIRGVVMGVDGVSGCHNIRTRGRPDDIHVDLHILVNPLMHVGAAHNITEMIEKGIRKNVAGVTDVVVHVEPKNDRN